MQNTPKNLAEVINWLQAHPNETIRRNAISIHKQLLKEVVHQNINPIPCSSCKRETPQNLLMYGICGKCYGS